MRNNLITRGREEVLFVSPEEEASSSRRMPRQKSAPKRSSGIDLGLLLNRNDENTNTVAKLFLSGVKNKEEEEEEKNATKTPTVLTNFNNDVLDNDDDEKVEDQNTNNVLRLVKTLEIRTRRRDERWRRRWAWSRGRSGSA